MNENIDNTLPDRKELISMLKEMIKAYEHLSPGAMVGPVSHYDMMSALILIKAIFEASDEDKP